MSQYKLRKNNNTELWVIKLREEYQRENWEGQYKLRRNNNTRTGSQYRSS